MADSKAAMATQYLNQHKISEGIQEALLMLLDKSPEDPYGTLSRHFKQLAPPPVVDHLIAREVLDSRGNPTVEVDVYVKYLGIIQFAGRSSAPSGASTGSNEAREIRDKDSPRYGGKGTLTAVKNVNEILSNSLKGFSLADLQSLDAAIRDADGTELKEKIGGNACTATSFALAESASFLYEEPLFIYLAKQFHKELPKKFKLPSPFFNIINGGKHAGGKLKIQEFMVSPKKDLPFPDQVRIISEVYQKLGLLLTKQYGPSAKNLGDEGGFAPLLNTPEEALTIIEKAIQESGYKPGEDIFLALDAAASEFYNSETKLYEIEENVFKNGEEMIQYWKNLINKHPAIISIEDGLDEKDTIHWIKLNSELGEKIHLIGDDLFTTNPKIIQEGIEEKWANSLLLKVNQIGTISEAMDAARLMLEKNQWVMVSHRSGETCNTVISDLAVAIGAQAIKTGSTARGERIQKYTRLIQIYEYLKEKNLLDE